MDFLKANSDKILLAAFVVYLSLFSLHTAHDGRDTKLAEWGTKTADMLTGALLTLITGGRLTQRRVETEGGGTDPDSGKPAPKAIVTSIMSTDQHAPDVGNADRRATDVLHPAAPVPVEVVNPPEKPVPTEESKEKKP